MYKYALFDLDGTLTDSSLGITNSIMYALERLGRDVPPREELYRFIGPPLIPAFMELLGMSEDEARLGLKYYREYFTERGMLENSPYNGISDTLARLFERGVTMAVATSKPEPFAVKICGHFGIARYFAKICGATLDEGRTDKADVIAYAMSELEIPQDSVIMVGDKSHDIIGAHKNGIPAIGVLWGFGGRDELTNASAEHIAENMRDMAEMILK